jgi:hypothetical protein
MDLNAVGSATAKFTGVLQHFIYHSDQSGERVQMPPNAARVVAEPEHGLLSNRIGGIAGRQISHFRCCLAPRLHVRAFVGSDGDGILTGRFLDWRRLVGRNRGVLEERVPFLTSTVCRLRVMEGWTSVASPGAAIFNRIVYSVGSARAHAIPLVRHCRAKGL